MNRDPWRFSRLLSSYRTIVYLNLLEIHRAHYKSQLEIYRYTNTRDFIFKLRLLARLARIGVSRSLMSILKGWSAIWPRSLYGTRFTLKPAYTRELQREVCMELKDDKRPTSLPRTYRYTSEEFGTLFLHTSDWISHMTQKRWNSNSFLATLLCRILSLNRYTSEYPPWKITARFSLHSLI